LRLVLLAGGQQLRLLLLQRSDLPAQVRLLLLERTLLRLQALQLPWSPLRCFCSASISWFLSASSFS